MVYARAHSNWGICTRARVCGAHTLWLLWWFSPRATTRGEDTQSDIQKWLKLQNISNSFEATLSRSKHWNSYPILSDPRTYATLFHWIHWINGILGITYPPWHWRMLYPWESGYTLPVNAPSRTDIRNTWRTKNKRGWGMAVLSKSWFWWFSIWILPTDPTTTSVSTRDTRNIANGGLWWNHITNFRFRMFSWDQIRHPDM